MLTRKQTIFGSNYFLFKIVENVHVDVVVHFLSNKDDSPNAKCSKLQLLMLVQN